MDIKESTSPILELCPVDSDYLIIVHTDHGLLKVTNQGNIETDEGVSINEASVRFWKALALYFPSCAAEDLCPRVSDVPLEQQYKEIEMHIKGEHTKTMLGGK